MMIKLEEVKRQVALFHSAIDKEERKGHDNEEDWEDTEEEDEDEESKQYVLEG